VSITFAALYGNRIDALPPLTRAIDRQSREGVMLQQVTKNRTADAILRAQFNPHFWFNLLNTVAD
jgi:LytS/YehU family sensor histidine kinase